MLCITIPGEDIWDPFKEEFIAVRKDQTLQLEHSLVSLQKWESKWCKSFIATKDKTPEEILDYIKCMTITQNVNPEVYNHLTNDNIAKVDEYINAPMTATVFTEDQNAKHNREVVTAEIIYYWMIALNIPFEYRKWHLNQLLTLIQVCNIKNTPPKKMSAKDILSRNRALNEARRKKFNTTG